MKKFTIIAILTSMLFSTFLKAEDVQIVVVKKPSALEEGTQRDLSPAQIAELLPWAKDSKTTLSDLLENLQGLAMADRVSRMVDGIQQVVGESAPKNSELFMRYVLNRALVLNDMLDKEIDVDSIGAIDVKSRVLVLSIKMAIKYYDIDSAKLADQKIDSPFASFGKEYFYFLKELNKSIFDASAQYKIERTSLEWLQWDLYRDLNNATYAPAIIKINNALRLFPSTKLTDTQSINYIKQVRKVSEGIDLTIKPNIQVKPNDEKSPKVNVQPKANYENIAIGTKVIDNDGKAGVVEKVFTNGVAVVRVDGFTYNKQVSTLSKEVDDIDGIRKNTNVMLNRNERIGVVEIVYANGVAIVRVNDGFAYYEKVSTLSIEVDGIGNIKKNDKVMEIDGSIGTVELIFANGVALIRINNGFARFKQVSELIN